MAALPFPRREIYLPHLQHQQRVLEHKLLQQIHSTLGHLRYQQSTLTFPQVTTTAMTKKRSHALPHLSSPPSVDNNSEVQDLDAAVYCRQVRQKLKEQEIKLLAEQEAHRQRVAKYKLR